MPVVRQSVYSNTLTTFSTPVDIARDLRHRVVFFMADLAHQIDDAMRRRHVDARRIEIGQAGEIEQRGLDARGQRVVLAPRPESFGLAHFELVDDALACLRIRSPGARRAA